MSDTVKLIIICAAALVAVTAVFLIIRFYRYRIKFFSDGGSRVKSVRARKGENFLMPAPPVKRGCVFCGWYEDKALTRRFVYTELKKRGGIKLYAKWVKGVSSATMLPYGALTRKERAAIRKRDAARKKDGKITSLYPTFKRNETPLKRKVGQVVYVVVGAILSALFLFPIVYMLATSTKSESAYAAGAGSLKMFLPDFANLGEAVKNYTNVFENYGIWRYAVNSFTYAAIVIVLNILVNGLAGYVMAKLRFPGKRFLSFMIIFLIVVPVETSIIPLYSIVKIMLGLKNTMSVLGVILPASISIFNVFLFTQFFGNIPQEYEEAARIDGADTLGVFFKVILPLSKPIVATVAVFCFIGVWNDYLWPSMILPYASEGQWPLYPIQSALTTIQSIQGITTGEIMASLIVTSIPIFIIYVLAQKYIVQGFGTAGLKM